MSVLQYGSGNVLPGRPALEQLDDTNHPALTKNNADTLDGDELNSDKMATDEQPSREDLKKARGLPSHPLRLSSPQARTAMRNVQQALGSPSSTIPGSHLRSLPSLASSSNPSLASLLTRFRPRQEDAFFVPSGFWDKGLWGSPDSIMSVQVAPVPAAAKLAATGLAAAKPLEPIDVAVAERETNVPDPAPARPRRSSHARRCPHILHRISKTTAN